MEYFITRIIDNILTIFFFKKKLISKQTFGDKKL